MYLSAAMEIERMDQYGVPRVFQASCVWSAGGAPARRDDPLKIQGKDRPLISYSISRLLGLVSQTTHSLLACSQRFIMALSQDLHKTLHASGSYLPFLLMPANA
jgi:hypothetical protein